jgi:hypothetical protein
MVQQIGMLGFFFMYMVVGKDKGPLDPHTYTRFGEAEQVISMPCVNCLTQR